MAIPTEWYTSLQQGGAPVLPPDRRGRGGGGGGGGGGRGGQFNDFLSKQRSLRHAIAKEELGQLKTRGAADRWEDAARRRTPTQTGQTSWQRGPQGPARGRGRGPQGPSGATAAKAMLNMSGRMGAMPFQARDLGTWLDFIGPGRAHQGLMQTGRLLSGGSVGPDAPEGLPPYPGMGPSGAGAGAGHNVGNVGRGPTRTFPQREKGGTIPETGPYELHKGEIVISADQVDRPLMAALKGDKLNKMYSGQMDGKGTGPGPPTAKSMVEDEFEGGTLGGYQRGSVMEYPEGPISTAEIMRMLQEQRGGSQSGNSLEDFIYGPQEFRTDPGTLERFGETIGRVTGLGPEEGMIGRTLGAAGKVAGPITRGIYGPEEPETALAGQNLEKPEHMGAESLAGILDQVPDPLSEQQERDRLGGIANEATFARAAAGDRGLGEAGPLTLQRGGPTQRTSYEPGDRADPALQAREKREFNATMNEMKADRLMDFLSEKGSDLDPDTFKAVEAQAKQLRAINKANKDRQADLRAVEATLFQKAQEAILNYEGAVDKARVQAEAVGTRWNRRDQQAEYRDLKRSLLDMQDSFGQGKYDDFDGIMDLMASLQQSITLHDTGNRISREKAKLLLQHDMEDDFTEEDLAQAWQELDLEQ